jgi:hypothetical protein
MNTHNTEYQEALRFYRSRCQRQPQNELEATMQALEDRFFNPPVPEAHESRIRELEGTYGFEAGEAVRAYDKWLRERYRLDSLY